MENVKKYKEEEKVFKNALGIKEEEYFDFYRLYLTCKTLAKYVDKGEAFDFIVQSSIKDIKKQVELIQYKKQ